MPSYTLEIEAFGIFTTNAPLLEIWEDGVLDSTHSIVSSGSTISVTINYGGTLPTSLALTFNDGFAAAGRTIEIQSVKINDKYVNVGNYLSSDSLTKGQTATVDIDSVNTNDSDFIFDSSDPAASEFTTGVTQAFTAVADTFRDYNGTTDQVFDMLGGRDVAYLGSGDDKVTGGSGDDILRGGAGNDLLFGDTGDDRIYGEDDDDTIYGGDGNDRLHGNDGNDEIHGGDGDDRINGNDGNDILTGGEGDDKLGGGSGTDYLFGGDDDDTLTGGAGNDTLDGGDGNDRVYGGIGNDYMNGGNGDDILIGQNGDDIIHGDNGNDTIYAGLDDDEVYGGNGNDIIIGSDLGLIDTTQQVIYDAGQNGAGTVTQFTGGMTLDGNLWRKVDGDFRITANTVIEFDFKSTLEAELSGIGFDNNNSLSSGFIFEIYGTQTNIGNQTFNDYDGSGEWAHYTINVGAFYTGSFSNIFFINDDDGNAPNDGAPLGNSSWANIIMYESTLVDDDDTLDGGDGNDQIIGAKGVDTINGGEGDDNISGNDGNDILSGGAGNDTIHGGDNNDTIDGGSGDDTISGNDGNDTIHGDGDFDRDTAISDILTANPSVVYSVATDSFYQLVTTNRNFVLAKSNANATIINGVGGHLANITSAAENNFIDNLIVGDTWIGGSDSVSEGVWIWEEGHEAGQQFWAGAAAGSSVGGFYENWAGGEPNDSGSGEDHVTIRTNGTWNDLRGTSSRDYIIEWEADSVLGSMAGNDTLYGGDGDDIIYGDYASAIVGSAQGWLVQYYDLGSAPSDLATAGFTLNGGRDNSNTVNSTGVTQDFDPSVYDPTNTDFALKYTTTLTITTGGTYTFRTTSDDGSALFLDGVQIVDNDGLHGAVTVTSVGQVLAAGTYTLEATFFERGGGEVMNVEMSGTDTGGGFIDLDSYADVNVNSNVGSAADGDDILYGGDGLDTLYGGGGSDSFVFEETSAFADTDLIMDFSTIDGDILDISDLLTGAFSGTITDYVQFSLSGGDTLVQVDVNGLTGGSSFQTIASLENLTGLDEATLFADGNIVV